MPAERARRGKARVLGAECTHSRFNTCASFHGDSRMKTHRTLFVLTALNLALLLLTVAQQFGPAFKASPRYYEGVAWKL
jgi:hypothetical protein